MAHLVEEHSSVDPTYVEDFLLTYRTFLKSPVEVSEKLTDWFNDPNLRDKVSLVDVHIKSMVHGYKREWGRGECAVFGYVLEGKFDLKWMFL